MRISRPLIGIESFMALVLAAYLSTFPIFNEIPGSDLGVHLAFSRDIAHGILPSLSSALLYQGVEFYLAIGQILFPHANPFVIVRLSMALLVFVSPLVVYICAKELFEDSFKAEMAALVYATTGWIWVDWVLVTGLYANFYGFLASLLLVAATFRFARKKAGVLDLGLLILAFVNAVFSHYTTLLVLPPLVGYLIWKRNLLGSAVFMIPMVAGVLLFPSMFTSLLNFLAPTTVIGPSSSSLPPFSLWALDAVLTDYEFGFLMLGALAFGYLAFRKRDSKMLFLLAWFVLPIVVAPLNSSAWRFAFMSLVPGTLMLGYVLALVPKFPLTTRKGVNHANFYRTLLLVGLVVSPAFYPSWGYLALTHSFQNDPQQGVYDSLVWLGTHLSPNYTRPGPGGPYLVCNQSPQDPHCPHVVSVDDWRLTYSPLLGGPDVLYAPDYGVSWQDPLQTALFALSHDASYIAITKDSTVFVPACDQGGSLKLTLSASSSSAPLGSPIGLQVSAVKGLNLTVSIYDNGLKVGQIPLVDGNGSAAFRGDQGPNQVFAALGNVATESLNLTVGSPADGVLQRAPVPPDYCSPWRTFNSATLPQWALVFSNADVRIWKAP